jgi:hypothetical protein
MVLQVLKQDIAGFLADKFGPDHFTNLNDAFIGMVQNKSITEDERNMLRQMSHNNDTQLMNAWNRYLNSKDEDDLVSTFKAMCAVQKRKMGNQGQPAEPTGFGISVVQN